MENTALLIAIIQNAIDGIITIDDHGVIELMNPSASKLFGYLPEETIGKNIASLIPTLSRNNQAEEDMSEDDQWKSTFVGRVAEVNGMRKDHSTFPLRLCISEVIYFNRTIFTAFTHDLSKQKLAEDRLREYAAQLEQEVQDRTQSLKDTVHALRQAKEDVSLSLKKEQELGLLKNRFVSMASHEFRTPLSTILSSASLLSKYTLTEEQEKREKHIQRIKSSVTNLTGILNEFLSIGKIEDGKVIANPVLFNLKKYITSLRNEMSGILKANQKILYTHKGNEDIFLDLSLLKNVLINLISNAIKFSAEKGTILITSEVKNKKTKICIKDEGIGMSDEDKKHLFERFYRGTNATNIQGTGLGLHIVGKYIELMDGTISIISELEKGTEITVTFHT